jgi:hypothetical protein
MKKLVAVADYGDSAFNPIRSPGDRSHGPLCDRADFGARLPGLSEARFVARITVTVQIN